MLSDALQERSNDFAIVAKLLHRVHCPGIDGGFEDHPSGVVSVNDVADLMPEDESPFVFAEFQPGRNGDCAQERIDLGQPGDIHVLQRRTMVKGCEQAERSEHIKTIAQVAHNRNP